MNDKRDALAQLFRSAGQAHHRAFASVNGDDPEWPDWYAQYLAGSLSQLLGTQIERVLSSLTYFAISTPK